MRNTFKPVSTDTGTLDLNFHLFPAVFTTSQTALRVQYYRWRNNEQLSVNWNTGIITYLWRLLYATAHIYELLKPPGTHKEALQLKAPRVGSGLLLKICIHIPIVHRTVYSQLLFALSPPSSSTHHSNSRRLNSVKQITRNCHQTDKLLFKINFHASHVTL
jgi:hypothetical protein